MTNSDRLTEQNLTNPGLCPVVMERPVQPCCARGKVWTNNISPRRRGQFLSLLLNDQLFINVCLFDNKYAQSPF